MDLTKLGKDIITVSLSRTNLTGLLNQLDDHAKDAQIIRRTDLGLLLVHAQEDEDHYVDGRVKGVSE